MIGEIFSGCPIKSCQDVWSNLSRMSEGSLPEYPEKSFQDVQRNPSRMIEENLPGYSEESFECCKFTWSSCNFTPKSLTNFTEVEYMIWDIVFPSNPKADKVVTTILMDVALEISSDTFRHYLLQLTRSPSSALLPTVPVSFPSRSYNLSSALFTHTQLSRGRGSTQSSERSHFISRRWLTHEPRHMSKNPNKQTDKQLPSLSFRQSSGGSETISYEYGVSCPF